MQTAQAPFAGDARPGDGAHADPAADRQERRVDVRADPLHDPDDLVPGHHGEPRDAELVVDETHVGAADTAVGDADVGLEGAERAGLVLV